MCDSKFVMDVEIMSLKLYNMNLGTWEKDRKSRDIETTNWQVTKLF